MFAAVFAEHICLPFIVLAGDISSILQSVSLHSLLLRLYISYLFTGWDS